MSAKEIEVECPCCGARLSVDVLTSKVMRASPPAQVDETGRALLDEGRWLAAHGRVKDRPQAAKDEFDRALDHEKGKEARLDDLFEKAKRKQGRRGPGGEG